MDLTPGERTELQVGLRAPSPDLEPQADGPSQTGETWRGCQNGLPLGVRQT